jgi:hypothetical protein
MQSVEVNIESELWTSSSYTSQPQERTHTPGEKERVCLAIQRLWAEKPSERMEPTLLDFHGISLAPMRT